ncbi:MAG: hypothetical protein FJ044_05525 [Candidatus Cloacimonetes bacterium]|nr:hypothetical protein [Candidatus Cloacimonadota bacterium]
MVSKILLKLIDEAILPAVFTIAGKIFSLAVIIYLARVPWEFSTSGNFPTLTFVNSSDLIFVNSYSNLIMFLIIVLGFLWVLARAHIFHDTHISPSLTLRLLAWDLSSLLTSSRQVYQKAVVWFAFLWLSVLFLGLQALLAINYFWIFLLAAIAAIFLTWVLVEDLEREMAIIE